MSYRRKVHCRYCGETGHNRNGCSKLKDYIKNNPNSYTAHRHNERMESIKHRKCSYCNQEGHNRKTCSHIMSDMIKVAIHNQGFRRKFLDNIIKKNGIAPGALITLDNTSGYDSQGVYRYDLKDKMALITDISFNDVRFPNKDGHCNVVKIQFMDIYDYGGKRLCETYIGIPNWFILGAEPPSSNWYRNRLDFKVVSPGHYDMENEEDWLKNKEAVELICEDYNNHIDLQYALDRIAMKD